jgi:hypothetical protein
MKNLKNLVPQLVRDELESCGLPWDVVNGGKHFQLRLNGQLVGILPKGRCPREMRRTELAQRSNVRRALRAASG